MFKKGSDYAFVSSVNKETRKPWPLKITQMKVGYKGLPDEKPCENAGDNHAMQEN